jgi:hypothetical protein
MLSFALTLLCLLANEPALRIDNSAVWNLSLEVSEENIQRLRKEPRKEVPARLRIGSQGPNDVLIRLKGHGTFLPVDQKPSFTVLSQKSPAPFGTKKFHLNNSAEDPTYLKEIIGSEIFRAGGVPAPKVGHAEVLINGRPLGIYVLKEGFTEEFLAATVGEPVGFLYDTAEGHDVDQPLEIDIGDPGPAREKLHELAAELNEPDHSRRLEKITALLDVNSILKFLALEIIICHWDGYGLSQNNFRLHFGGRTRQFRFLPTGMDQIFAKPDYPWNPPMAGLVAKSILELDAANTRYTHIFEATLSSLNIQHLSNRITILRERLRPFTNRGEFAEIQRESDLLITNIANRVSSLRTQLAAPNPTTPEFIKGIAFLDEWQPLDAPERGQLLKERRGLRIVAGPKTSASWQTKVVLGPGVYRFSAGVSTRDVVALPFGTRNGATIRVLGHDAISESLKGTTDSIINCRFQVAAKQSLTLVCELRASGGEAVFSFPLTLELLKKR